MADETVRIIRIETGGSEQTVKGLKDEINSLRDALLNTEKGTEDYKKVLEQLIADQQKLAEVMNAGKSQVSAATGSYNALVNQMTALKKVWRETTDEASRKEIGNQIKNLNDKLKGMDESIGDYRRNVGNYANSISTCFAQMGGAAKGMVGPLSSVKAGLTAISSHPIVAVITVLVGLLVNGLAKGFKNSETAANKLKVSFSALQGIADLVSKAFEKVALWIAGVTEKAVKLLDILGLLNPELKKSMEERKKIAEDEIKLDDKKRDNIKRNADLEKEAAEARAKAEDKDKYTAEERLKFLEEAEKKEQEIAKNELDALQLEYDIAYAKLQINKDNADLKQAEAEAYAKLTKAKTDYYNKEKSLNKALSRTRKEMQTDAENAAMALLKLERDLLQQEYDLALDGSQKQLDLAKEMAAKDREIAAKEATSKIKDKEKLNKALLLIDQNYYKKVQDLEEENWRKSYEAQNEYNEAELTLMRDGSIEKIIKQIDLKNKQVTKLEEHIKELNSKPLIDEKAKRQAELDLMAANAQLAQLSDDFTDTVSNTIQKNIEVLLDGVKPTSTYYYKYIKYYDEYVEQMKVLGGKNSEDQDDEYLRFKSYVDKREELAKKYRDACRLEMETSLEVIDITERMGNLEGGNWFDDLGIVKLSRMLQRESPESTQKALKSYYETMLKFDRSGLEASIQSNAEQLVKDIQGHIEYVIEHNNLGSKEEEDKMRAMFLKFWGGSMPTAEELKEKIGKDFNETMATLINYGLLPEDQVQEYLSDLKGLTEAEEGLLQERSSNWEKLVQNVSKFAGSIGDIYAITLEDKKKALEKEGKYTEQERKNLEQRYKTVQAMQIAQAVINTIAGALGAFMGITKDTGGWGIAAAAAEAAAVTAAGVAQIMKIKQTNPYSDNSSSLSSGGAMSATVTPTVSDFNPEYTTNLSGRSDTDYLNQVFGNTKLFVSVVDINDAQERGRVRVAESSF